ncbi:MAG: Ig-like domain-containing protein, partial [Ghiorsea sp.]|nr:Ig-like domain-containing protein [Ghiorsea sp.]
LSDGSDSVTITATVLDVYSVVIPNAQVTFSSNTGAISSGLVTTDAAGTASITLNKGAAIAGAAITVTASVAGTVGAITSPVNISVVDPTLVTQAASLTLNTSQATLLSDGSDSVTITATVLDVYSVVIPNAQVTFSSNSGTISSGLVTTDAAGIASITLNKGAAIAGATITVTASVAGTVGAITANAAISVVDPLSVPVSINLAASAFTVLSDGIDSSTITATVLDINNAAAPNATVLFSASGGVLSAASGVTDTTGKVQITFSASTTGFNGLETISATLSGVTPAVTRQLPIQIVGTTVGLTPVSVNITDDGITKDTLQVVLKNASNAPLYNVPVTVTQAGTGAATITPSAANTDVNGQISVDVVGTLAGNVTLTVSAAGATSTQQYTVSVTGTAFGITAPAIDPYGMAVGDAYTLTVNAPGLVSVTFATTTGTLTGANPVVGPASVITQTVVAGTASATLTGATAGVATVQVYDTNNPNTKDFTKITISPPISATSIIR